MHGAVPASLCFSGHATASAVNRPLMAITSPHTGGVAQNATPATVAATSAAPTDRSFLTKGQG